MQFVANGPDIPDALIHAHEEGEVVFFCGAGISYPAGLPGFKELTEEIYKRNNTTCLAIEQRAFEREQFDVALNLLEQRLPGQRQVVRETIKEILQPKLRRKNATKTHESLLHLGCDREGILRLVTTNFDRVFHKAAKRIGQTFHAYEAPMLPVPKDSRWNGVAYLHGLLPEQPNKEALNRLIVTSGDFGLAYLVERWAARFVSELFRNYVVCFVGYSINDPILRYMMDALAADRLLGERTSQAWAFGGYKSGKEQQEREEWEAKGVTPILYPANGGDHSALHQTLHAWAATYRDGIQGKKAIIARHAAMPLHNTTQQDDFVGRVLWALADKSGDPAKLFAEINPVPSLDWLDVLLKEQFNHSDLIRFGVQPHEEVDTKLSFSLIKRPSPYQYAPWMSLVLIKNSDGQWDKRMEQLARWLLRHLDDPKLLLWLVQQGSRLHHQLSWRIRNQLKEFAELERNGETTELERIRSAAPKAIPSLLMQTLWHLLLNGQIMTCQDNNALYEWLDNFKRNGLTVDLRLVLRKLLAPKIKIRKPHRSTSNESNNKEPPTRIRQLVDWDIVLTVDGVAHILRDWLKVGEQASSIPPSLLDEFQLLLRDALDLMHELGEADSRHDRSFWDLPSIAPHRQNWRYRPWTILIELLRNTWLAAYTEDRERAAQIARYWFEQPYPTFKRLALFAASKEECLSPEQWTEWLLADDAWWLWTPDTQREMFRLLVLQGRHLTETSQLHLEMAILNGPPRCMYRDDMEEARWQEFKAHSIWLRLAKLQSSGLSLGEPAATRLVELSSAYPEWRLVSNERDEFSSWISTSGDPDYEDKRMITRAPRKRHELVQWLAQPPKQDFFYQDDWSDVCRTRFFHSLLALCDLAKKGEWPEVRWKTALQVWSKDEMVQRSWRYAAPLVQTMPEEKLQVLVYEVSWWIETAFKPLAYHEEILLDLCRKIMALPLDTEAPASVTAAMRHSIGHITQALIEFWFKRRPSDNDGLPDDIKAIFTELCNDKIGKYRYGRVILSMNLIALFRVDRTWTEEHLLPLLNWQNPIEAQAVWEGFLFSPRLYQPLLSKCKEDFIETAQHYDDLDESREQFISFLTYVVLETIESDSTEEWREMLGNLPQEGLEIIVQTLIQALEASDKQSKAFWQHRILPFWEKIWPKERRKVTQKISEYLARLAITADENLPSAIDEFKYWLQPIENAYLIIHLLVNSNKLCSRFPEESLGLLNKIIGHDRLWNYDELKKCLDEIKDAAPQLEKDARYKRLLEFG